MEAFNTSGGACHTLRSMKDKGVPNCRYQTVRYPGHHAIITQLWRNCDKATLREVLQDICVDDEEVQDVILFQVSLSKGKLYWLMDGGVECKDGWSAMARGTTIPAVAMADTVVNLNARSDKLSLTYEDVALNYNYFTKILSELGMDLD